MTAAVWSLEDLFALFASRLGGDDDRLPEADILDLVAHARAGDEKARRRLYTQHVDQVFRTVRGLVSSDADAEDVTQDALLTMLTSLDRYQPRADARFSTWVTTIAINTLRRRFRRRRPDLTETGELPDRAADDTDPADSLDRARRRRVLLQALSELPERERAMMSLRYGSDQNASEIATVFGLEAAGVRKILERTRERLGARMDQLLATTGVQA